MFFVLFGQDTMVEVLLVVKLHALVNLLHVVDLFILSKSVEEQPTALVVQLKKVMQV